MPFMVMYLDTRTEHCVPNLEGMHVLVCMYVCITHGPLPFADCLLCVSQIVTCGCKLIHLLYL